jgi:hypothetical protein
VTVGGSAVDGLSRSTDEDQIISNHIPYLLMFQTTHAARCNPMGDADPLALLLLGDLLQGIRTPIHKITSAAFGGSSCSFSLCFANLFIRTVTHSSNPAFAMTIAP